MELDRD